jgi:hypothetical protein
LRQQAADENAFWALSVICAGVPLGGQVPSAARAARQLPPIMALFTASKRRRDTKLRKFPSHSVAPQAVLIAVLVVRRLSENRVFVAS